MEIIRVIFPFFKTIPIRKACSGQVLEGEVYGRSDQLIAEQGTEIDDHLLTRFENFDVRRVVIREQQETWITDDSIGSLPGEAQVLERRSVRGTLADHTQELFGKNFDRTMTELVKEGQKEARKQDRDELVEDLEREQKNVDELEDRLTSIRESLSDLPDKTRNRIENVIEGTVLDLGRDFLQLPGPDDQLRKFLQFFKDRDQTRNKLIEVLSDYSEIFEEVDRSPESDAEQEPTDSLRSLVPNGRLDRKEGEFDPESIENFNKEADRILSEQKRIGKQLVEESDFESVGRKLIDATAEKVLVDPKTLVSVVHGSEGSLPERVQELLQQRENLRKKVHAVVDGEVNEVQEPENQEDSPEASTGSVKKLLDEFGEGRRKTAVQATIGFLRKQETRTEEYEEKLQELHSDLQRMEDEKKELHERVEESARDPEDRQYLEELMDGSRDFDPDRLLEMDVDMMLVEKIESHLKERTNAQDRFEDLMWDVKTDGRVKK